MNYIKAFIGALIAFFAFIAAARATQHRAKAKAISDKSEVDLIRTVSTGTAEAAAAAERALEHLDMAKAAEARATELVTKGADSEQTLADVTDRWRSRSVRDKPAQK